MNLDTQTLNNQNRYATDPEETVLVTGSNGFVGTRVVYVLLSNGFKNIRCFTRPTSNVRTLESTVKEFSNANVKILRGNLLSRSDCLQAMKGVSIVYHLAAGIDKTFPGCFLNSVVTTRNLLDAATTEAKLKRFVNVSSLAVYSNEKIKRGALLDESCPVETKLVERHDPYAYGKAKQDEILNEYAQKHGIPFVIIRPGVVFGPGKARIPGRVGIDTFGFFLHLGLNNIMPFTYVDNCAEAIMLAGLKKGIDGEVLNIVDDDLPKSVTFLKLYKKRVRQFTSIPVPYPAFYLFNFLWEKYSKWSAGQLPPVFNRKTCAAYYKGNIYSNQKAKATLGWKPKVPMYEGMENYFAYVRGNA